MRKHSRGTGIAVGQGESKQEAEATKEYSLREAWPLFRKADFRNLKHGNWSSFSLGETKKNHTNLFYIFKYSSQISSILKEKKTIQSTTPICVWMGIVFAFAIIMTERVSLENK